MTSSAVLFGLAGGALIGASASVFLVVNGRIAGISGMVGALVSRSSGGTAEKVAFLGGLVTAGTLAGLVAPQTIGAPSTSLAWTAVAGFGVGVGTKLANGCTSGHGVCGVGRLSLRSIAATVAFLASAVVTVFVLRHLASGAP